MEKSERFRITGWVKSVERGSMLAELVVALGDRELAASVRCSALDAARVEPGSRVRVVIEPGGVEIAGMKALLAVWVARTPAVRIVPEARSHATQPRDEAIRKVA